MRVTSVVVSVTVTVASSVNTYINGSNWRLVFNQWQNKGAWHSLLGVDFAHAVGEIVTSPHHAIFAIHVFVKYRDV